MKNGLGIYMDFSRLAIIFKSQTNLVFFLFNSSRFLTVININMNQIFAQNVFSSLIDLAKIWAKHSELDQIIRLKWFVMKLGLALTEPVIELSCFP